MDVWTLNLPITCEQDSLNPKRQLALATETTLQRCPVLFNSKLWTPDTTGHSLHYIQSLDFTTKKGTTLLKANMASSYGYQPQQSQSYSAQNNLNFYQSSYSNQAVSGHTTPFQAAYGGGAQSSAYPQQGYGSSANYGFGAFPGQPGASGQMGTGQSGLRTGWLAAFGTEGYEGEPPLLEELGVNFQHIQMKVGWSDMESRRSQDMLTRFQLINRPSQCSILWHA